MLLSAPASTDTSSDASPATSRAGPSTRSGEGGEGGAGLDQHIVFKLVIILLVISNTLLMGLEADHPEWTVFWFTCENFFTAAFAMEMVFKLCILRKAYFFDRGNLMDFSIAMVAILDCWVLPFVDFGVDGQTLALFRILRLFRLVRVLRLVKGCRKLFLVVSSLIDAMQATLWVAGILLITIYVSAIFCVDLLGRSDSSTVVGYPGYTTVVEEIDASEIMMNYNPHIRWGNMSRAMFSLFNIVLSSEWAEIVTPIMLKQPPLVFFFISFVLITTLCTMNVIIGMICDSVVQHHQAIREAEQELNIQQKMNTLQEIQQLVNEMGTGSGGITNEILKLAFDGKESKLGALFENSDLKLPDGFTAPELFAMLDHNCDGSLEHEEFIQSLHRVIQSDPFQQMCIMQTGLNSLRRLVMEGHDGTRRLINDGQKRTEAMLAEALAAMASVTGTALGGCDATSVLLRAPPELPAALPPDSSPCGSPSRDPLVPGGAQAGRLVRLERAAQAIEANIRELLTITSAREKRLGSGESSRTRMYDELLHTLEAVVHALDGKVSEAFSENIGDTTGEVVGVPSSRSWPEPEFTTVNPGASFLGGWPGDGLTLAERSVLSRPVPDSTRAVSPSACGLAVSTSGWAIGAGVSAREARHFAASGGRGGVGRGVSIKL